MNSEIHNIPWVFYVFLCIISHSPLLFIHFKSNILDMFLVQEDYVWFFNLNIIKENTFDIYL